MPNQYIWAVFESQKTPIASAGHAELDCVASFRDEREAIDFQMANEAYRTRKPIPLPAEGGAR